MAEENLLFSVDKDGNMSGTNNLYPLDGGSTRNYYAYHPYSDTQSTTAISIDHTQTVPTTPLLWCNVENSNDASVALTFAHKLAKVTFNLSAGGGDISDLDSATATLKGANAKATFSIEDGGFSSVSTEAITLTISDGKIVAYLIPMSEMAGVTLDIIKNGQTFTTEISTTSWVGGSEYSYNVTVGISDIELKDGIYYINSANGLKAFSDLVIGVNNTTAKTKGFEFTEEQTADTGIKGVLTKDIDLSGICSSTSGANWSPIGRITSGLQFTGTFDGDGHKVSNLYINATSQQGLFGYIGDEGKVYNVGVTGTVTGTANGAAYQTAGLAANNYGFIINCYSEVNVTGDINVGGIVAHNTGYVVNCYNRGTISGDKNIGGIVGHNEKAYVGYCYSTGDLPTTDVTNSKRIGGVVGYNTVAGTTDSPLVKGSFCLDNTIYSIGQVAASGDGSGLDGNVCTEDYLKSESFATTINNGSALYNSETEDNPPVKACAWNAVGNDSYPTLNFGVEASSTDLDISYNSISYNIYSENGLLAFAALVNGGSKPDGVQTSGDDMYFQFGSDYSDIDGKLIDNITISTTWTSIGTSGDPYSGTFDFNSKTISGITIDSTNDYSVLFGYTTDGFAVQNYSPAD